MVHGHVLVATGSGARMASKSSVETCGFPADFPQHDRQKQIAFIGEFAGYFCFPSFSVLTRFPPGFPSIIFRTATLGGPAQSDFGSFIPIKRAKATSSSVSMTGLPTGFRGAGVGAGGLARAVRKLSRHGNGGLRPAYARPARTPAYASAWPLKYVVDLLVSVCLISDARRASRIWNAVDHQVRLQHEHGNYRLL